MSAVVLHTCLLLGVLSLFASPAQADVWKYVDASGVTHFTNEPPKASAQLIIRSGSGHVGVARGNFLLAPDASAQTTVAVMQELPAYKAAHNSLSAASQSYGVDLDLIKAVAVTESAFNPVAVSNKGAVGLMQVMPATARRYGVHADRGGPVASKLTNPELNIQTGTRYLSDLLRLFGGQTELALAAYNAGEGAVARAGNQIPNFKETQNYVQKVMSVYRLLQSRAG